MPIAVLVPILVADVLVGVGTVGTLAIVDVPRLMFDGVRPGRGPQESVLSLVTRRCIT